MERIMITGAMGQIGTELVKRMRGIYGPDNIMEITEDMLEKIERKLKQGVP